MPYGCSYFPVRLIRRSATIIRASEYAVHLGNYILADEIERASDPFSTSQRDQCGVPYVTCCVHAETMGLSGDEKTITVTFVTRALLFCYMYICK